MSYQEDKDAFPSLAKQQSSTSKSKRVSFQKGERIVLSERSLRDPLSLDTEASQHVPIDLDQITTKKKTAKEKSYEKFLGVEFDDDTDYLQFMKANPDEVEQEQPGFMTIEDVHNMQLGKDIMGDYVDPEVAFMLEDEFDDEKDEFVNDKYTVVQTMKDLEKSEEKKEKGGDIDNMFGDLMNGAAEVESDGEDDFGDMPHTSENTKIMDWMTGESSMPKPKSNLKQRSIMQIPEDQEIEDFEGSEGEFDDFDKKTTFTQYSMSSSVMKRSEHLTQIDDTFESVVETLYRDEDVGDLEFEAEEIYNASEELNENAVYRLLNIHNDQVMENSPIYGEEMDPQAHQKRDLIRKTLELQSRQKEVPENYDPGEDLINEMERGREPKPQFDCESILSTKSNIYNRPKYVDESKTFLKNQKTAKIQLNKMGLPMGPGASFKQLNKAVKAAKKIEANSNSEGSDCDSLNGSGDNMSQMTTLTVLLSEASVRNKNESPAERKQRKSLVKELRKARREERKNTRMAFREEGIKQAKADINRSRDTAIRL
jgi:protein LTV1